jgi:hypothetical protein
MAEFVGVTHFVHLAYDSVYGVNSLKQQALMFDRIAIANLSVYLKDRKRFAERMRTTANDIDWLLEQEIIFEAEEPLRGIEVATSEESELYHILTHANWDLTTRMERKKRKTEKQKDKFINQAQLAGDVETRMLSLLLRQNCNLEAYPVASESLAPLPTEATKSEVVEIILKKLPYSR